MNLFLRPYLPFKRLTTPSGASASTPPTPKTKRKKIKQYLEIRSAGSIVMCHAPDTRNKKNTLLHMTVNVNVKFFNVPIFPTFVRALPSDRLLGQADTWTWALGVRING